MIDTGRQLLRSLKLCTDYLGYNYDEERYETFEEAVDHVMATHEQRYAKVLTDLRPYIEEARKAYKEGLVLASQRNLQFRGDDIHKHNFRMYNCCTMYADKLAFLGNAFYLLLCGCGVGVNMMLPFVTRLPRLTDRTKGVKSYVVEDSIEGWAKAAHVLMSSYSERPVTGYEEYQGFRIQFDFSKIRPKNSKVGRRFKAPGHEGLAKSLAKIESLLNSVVGDSPVPFKSITAYDCFMHLADAVLSGGVRRAACSIILSYEDTELLNAKTGYWFNENPQRARSNNSVGLLRGSFTKEEFETLLAMNDGMSDIGFVFLNNIFEVLNPCVVGDTWVNTSEGLKQVADLVSKPFTAIVDGKPYDSKGFWLVGSKKCVTLKFKSGRTITCTGGHMFKTYGAGEWIRAEDLRMGDFISIQNNQDQIIEVDATSEDFSRGYLVGSVIGDGNFSERSAEVKFWQDKEYMHELAYTHLKNAKMDDPRHSPTYSVSAKSVYSCLKSTKLYDSMVELGCVSENGSKVFGDFILKQSKNFLAGFVRGYFDADGSVIGDSAKGLSVRLVSTEITNLQKIQEILLHFGISSKIYQNRLPEGYRHLPNGNNGLSPYYCKATHELVISKNSIDRFEEVINFSDRAKQKKLSEKLGKRTRPAYQTQFFDEVCGIEDAGYQLVYDCSVEEVNAFSANGLMAHNCFEISFTPFSIDSSATEAEKAFLKERAMKNDITILNDPRVTTGVQCCNLTEGNGSKCYSEEEFIRMCRALAILGTLQAGYTDFKHLEECLDASKKVSEEEALLGCSITGWANSPHLFNAELLQKGANVVLQINEEVAKIIGINPTARATCVKPSGNASVLLECASGIHPEHAKRYFRVMQLNKQAETAEWLEINMPQLLENGVYSATNSDYAVFVPHTTDEKRGVLTKKEMRGIAHLELIKLVQENWVQGGRVADRGVLPTTCHNVSNTVIIDDKKEITDYLFENQYSFTAVSFLSDNGDRAYAQAPFTEVLTMEELQEKYKNNPGLIFASGLIVDALSYFSNNLWMACDAITQPSLDISSTKELTMLRKHWISRAKKFAKNYFKGNVSLMIDCLKDVYLLHKWHTIQRVMKPVDFSSILKEPTFLDTDNTSAVACAGGACEIPQRSG